MGIKILTILSGGEKIPKGQCKEHILVGTPGKVFDLVKKRIVNVDKVKVFILDEADVMLNQENQMGKDVSNTRKHLPENVQVLFFSATYPDHVRDFAKKIVPNAAKITVENADLSVDAIKQMYLKCKSQEDKFKNLCELYGAMNVGQSVIFVNSRKRAFELAKKLQDAGHAVSLICGTQASGPEKIDVKTRDKVMKEFRDGVTKVLVATDVLARGIDVPAVTLVVNYEVPILWEQGTKLADRDVDGETYLHRVGRTGRFGNKGVAVTMCDDHEFKLFMEIRDRYNIPATEVDPDFEMLEQQIKKCRR